MLFSLPRYDFHFNHCCFIFSGIGWSNWKLSSHNSWIVFLPFNKNSDTSPKGSYIELNMANNPLLVTGLSIIFMLKQGVSLSVFYKTPRALSSGTFPVNRSWSFTPAFLSSSGIEDSTSGWWLINLVVWNHQLYTSEKHSWSVILLPLHLLLILKSHQNTSFITEFLLLLGKSYHCCLLLLSSMHSLSNLRMKYHKIYVCTSDSQKLFLKDCFLPTTDSVEGFFGVEVPKLGKTWIWCLP